MWQILCVKLILIFYSKDNHIINTSTNQMIYLVSSHPHAMRSGKWFDGKWPWEDWGEARLPSGSHSSASSSPPWGFPACRASPRDWARWLEFERSLSHLTSSGWRKPRPAPSCLQQRHPPPLDVQTSPAYPHLFSSQKLQPRVSSPYLFC